MPPPMMTIWGEFCFKYMLPLLLIFHTYVQVLGSRFALLEALNFNHRGRNKIPARTRIPSILIMDELRKSG